ncbi:MAG: methyltransferase [Clostridiaceae bacterium]|nr:methyltransferase [Clostridiaceae bacterium]
MDFNRRSEEGVPSEHPLFVLEDQVRPVCLYPDDTVEDLQRGGLRLLQKKNGFRFGTDSVMLAAYASAFFEHTPEKDLLVADLGAGCGAVALLLAARLPQARIWGVELDETSCSTFARNIVLNHLEHRMQAVRQDVRQIAAGRAAVGNVEGNGRFDLVVSNPPYRRPGQSWRRRSDIDAVSEKNDPANRLSRACEEIELDLNQLLQAASRLLKPGGRLVLVHQANRLPDVFDALRTWRLEARTLRLVQPLPERRPSIFLLSAVKSGKSGGFQIEPPLILADQPGSMTAETAAWYGHEPSMTEAQRLQGLIPVDGERKG